MFPSHLSHKYKNPFAAHVPTPLSLPLRSGSRACVWVLGLGLGSGLFRLFCQRGCELSDASQPTPRPGQTSPHLSTSMKCRMEVHLLLLTRSPGHPLPFSRIVAVMIFLLPFLFVSVSVAVAVTVFLLPADAVRGFHTAFAAWSGF